MPDLEANSELRESEILVCKYTFALVTCSLAVIFSTEYITMG